MKKITFGILMISLIVAGGIFALAQRDSQRFSLMHGKFKGKMFEGIARELNLSDEQKTQAKQVLDDARSRVEPLFDQLAENRKEITQLGTDGVYDERKVQELGDAQADLMKRLFIEKEKSKAQLFAILTAEQREKARQKINNFEGRTRKDASLGGGFSSGGGF